VNQFLVEYLFGQLKMKKYRQGLNLKKEDADKFYLNSKYNYFTYPEIEVLK